jgi:hypothetical protein
MDGAADRRGRPTSRWFRFYDDALNDSCRLRPDAIRRRISSSRALNIEIMLALAPARNKAICRIADRPPGGRRGRRACAARTRIPSPTDVASSPRGRILPSLVANEPLRRPLRDVVLTTAESDPLSRVPKRPSARTVKDKDQTSNLPRNWSFSSDENAPLAERSSTKSRQTSSVQSDEGAGVSPRAATPAQSHAVGDSGGLALSAKAKRSDKIAISRDDVRAKPLPSDQRSAG